MRSVSAATKFSQASSRVDGVRDGFISWLQDVNENSPSLRNLTDDEIKECFTYDKYRCLAKPQATDSDKISEVYASKMDRLSRCRSAQMTENDEFLVNPFGQWDVNGDPFDSLYIRQAYKDHWDIIQDHFLTKRSNQRILISGTPGCGKSVEGYYLLYKIFNTFGSNPPPILYAASDNSQTCMVFLRGFVFAIDDYIRFEQSLSYKIMDANGPIWHIYDSTSPGNHSGSRQMGPQIMISSPGRASRRDFKAALKGKHLVLYLPLPTFDEMHVLRTRYHNRKENSTMYISETKMIRLITKWGCIPRTIFEAGIDEDTLSQSEHKMSSAIDVERLIHMVGSSQIDHDVASGQFLHMAPIIKDVEQFEDLVETAKKDDAAKENEIVKKKKDKTSKGGEMAKKDETEQKGETAKKDEAAKKASLAKTDKSADEGAGSRKRTADNANVDTIGLSEADRITQLKARYTKVVYMWASDYIRDLAFDAFLSLGPERMMPLIVNYQQSKLGGFRGLLFEPFVFNLLTEVGVSGRFKNLDTGKDLGIVKLGPWKTKHYYQNHSQLNTGFGIMNIPLKSNEPAVDCLVPHDGYCFQISVMSGQHGINRPKFDQLMKSGVFKEFIKNNPRKNISFVCVVEAGQFDNFGRQTFHKENKKAYGKNEPERMSYPGVTQYAFEIDLRRIYKLEEHRQKHEMLNMVEDNTNAVERAFRRLRTK